MSHQPPPRVDRAFPPEPGVSCRCAGTVLLSESIALPVTLAFHYAAEEPYAVRMMVDTGMTPPVEWVFARDLLADGLEKPAGLGDVRTWPVPRRAHRLEAGKGGSVHVWISSPAGSATVSAPAAAVGDFLSRAFEEIGAGIESRMLRFDESISRLMTADRSEGETT